MAFQVLCPFCSAIAGFDSQGDFLRVARIACAECGKTWERQVSEYWSPNKSLPGYSMDNAEWSKYLSQGRKK